MQGNALLSGNQCVDLGLRPGCSRSDSLIAGPYPILSYPGPGPVYRRRFQSGFFGKKHWSKTSSQRIFSDILRLYLPLKFLITRSLCESRSSLTPNTLSRLSSTRLHLVADDFEVCDVHSFLWESASSSDAQSNQNAAPREGTRCFQIFFLPGLSKPNRMVCIFRMATNIQQSMMLALHSQIQET